MAAFLTRLDRLTSAMAVRRAERSRPFIDRKIVLSWNAAMIATLAEASTTFDNPGYLHAATRAARFILAEMVGDDGLRRVWFDGGAHNPAQLADTVALGLAFIALHDAAPEQADRDFWLDRARAMAQTVLDRFGPPGDGFRMTQARDGFATVVPVDDGNLASGNALALELFARLARRMQDTRMDQSALALTVELILRPGWHVNAHEPLEDFYISTDLAALDGASVAVNYPAPVMKTLSFDTQPLALYQGRLRLTARVPRDDGDPPREMLLTLQACNDEFCREPEEIRFALW